MRERKYLMNYKVGYLSLSVGVLATMHNEDKQTSDSSKEILENGVASGTKVATCTIKRN